MTRLPFPTSRWVGLAVLAIGLLFSHPARGSQITGIVSFGDSLSDVGNFYAATGGTSPPTQLGYTAGEFTNGWNWVQYLAHDLGVPMPTASSSGGNDYAYGGAMTGPGATVAGFWTNAQGGVTGAVVPNMDQQIAQYLSTNTPNATTLYTIWGGANDFLHGSNPNPVTTANNIVNEITTLANAGATQFMVGNLPLLGELPYIKQFQPSASAALDYLTVTFNGLLQADLAALQSRLGVQIHLLDAYSIYGGAVATPSQYGFTNVSGDPVWDPSSGPQTYLSFDGIHPTTQADQILGALASQAVPEPSSLILFATAMTAVGVWARRRR